MGRFIHAAVIGTIHFILQCQKVDGRVALFTPAVTASAAQFVATPLPSITSTSLVPTGDSHVRRQAQLPGKILIITSLQSLTYTAYPTNVCGLVAGNPASIYSCPSDLACAVANTAICCATNGVCSAVVSACQDYGWNEYSYEITTLGTVACGYGNPYCFTILHPGGYSGFVCSKTGGYFSILPGSNALSYYAGRTLVYSADNSNSLVFKGTISPPAAPTDVVGFLNRGNGRFPSCLTNMTAACPSLYSAVQGCWNTTTLKDCFCPNVETIRCPGMCGTGEGPADYINWVLRTCNSNNTESHNATSQTNGFKSQWGDFQTLEDDAYAALFPWAWQIKYSQDVAAGANATSYPCPSTRAKLGSFAIINVAVFAVAVLLGRRTWVAWYTCNQCGKMDSHQTFVYTALLSVALNLIANLINAALIRRHAGFHHLNIGNLVLLWASRPRLAWVVGLLVNMESQDQMYWNLGASAILAEVILQIIGSVYIGTTGNWARRYHFYLAHHLDNVPHGSDARIMYAGALLWLVAIGGAAIMAFLTFTPIGGLLWSGLKIAGQSLFECLKFSWRAVKTGAISLGRSFRWIWCWFMIGITTVYQMIWIRSEIFQKISDRPTIPGHPTWSRSSSGPNPFTTLSWSFTHKPFDMDDDFLLNLTLIVLFMAIPFVGQWLFWTGYLRMAEEQ